MKRTLFLALILNYCVLTYAYDFSKVDKALNALKDGKIPECIELIKKVAAANDVVAQFYLGQCYEYGIGVDKNPADAFKIYRRAAERGFAPAMKELSRCYKYGIGVEKNDKKFDEWIARYIKRNDTSNIISIADIYRSINVGDIKSSSKATGNNGSGLADARQPANTNIDASKQAGKEYEFNNSNIITTSRSEDLPKSDVDIDIPIVNTSRQYLFALIIANENYQEVSSVPNALNDGEIMAKYCKKTLGIPESNIHLIKNATLNNIKREMGLMKKIAEAYEGQASFIIYYAGHGFPDEKTRGAYLMPIDGYTSDLTTCYSLNDFYDTIGEMPSKKTIVMLDACFSGASREGDMLVSARGVVLIPKASIPSGNTIVISSASGDETAYPYSEKGHGLFTYFILEKLKESKGNVDIGSLIEYVKSNVAKKSLVINGKSQTPNVMVSRSLREEWKNWKIN